ncbi:MAG: AAA family ATPase [Saprospiraceae bacterium]|nr:AAA family ATPase [Saprospiraceae bacterium]
MDDNPACILKDLRFFADKSAYNYQDDDLKFRMRFDKEEITAMSWQLEVVNLNYKKQPGDIALTIKCTALTTRKEMFSLDQTISLLPNELIKVFKNSVNAGVIANWKADQYLWEVLMGGKVEMTRTMIVEDKGRVTQDVNPYFEILDTKLYRTDEAGTIRYLNTFNGSITDKVNIQLTFQRKFKESKNLEFSLIILNALTGQLLTSKQYNVSFPAKDVYENDSAYFSYGGDKPGYWADGLYFYYISFMGVTITSGQFRVAGEEVSGEHQPIDGNAIKQSAASKELNLEDVLKELDVLIGMNSIKKSIRENIEYLKFNKLRVEKGFADDGNLVLHAIFTGNPGTGKTTLVRLLGKIYKAMGLLSKGHVIEATRADLVGEFIGQTAPRTKKVIENARGGILFLDEIYALSRDNNSNDFGQECVEIILKEMSDGPGDIAIIGAGYPDEVARFLNSNPGLKSRFAMHYHFDDYIPSELMLIADVALSKEEVKLTSDAHAALEIYLTELYRKRDRNFGNARLVYQIIDEAKKQMGVRLLHLPDLQSITREEMSTIEEDDLRKVFLKEQKSKLSLHINQAELSIALEQLDKLVSLTQIKKEVNDKIQLVKFFNETGKDILNQFSLHAIFTGNPGTGKTTLARLLGEIYKALGLLERGHVVEVSRQHLVAGYVGQTAIKTAEVINKAMGGILFIDEAYSLKSNGLNDFGDEAIETLLKMMEDERGKFAVIAAGYPDNMNQFILSNPGLKSRFDSFYHFPDYSPEELFSIGISMLRQKNLSPDAEAAEFLKNYFKSAFDTRDKYFGNARMVRNSIENIVENQYLRMALLLPEQRSPEMLKTVILADVRDIAQNEIPKNQGIGFKSR